MRFLTYARGDAAVAYRGREDQLKNTIRSHVRIPALVSLGALAWCAVPASAQGPVVEIRAWIGGLSRLELSADRATWQHFSGPAPGRSLCQLGLPTWPIRPTYLDGVAWWPVWPDVPTCENRNCGGCRSDTWTGVPTPLPTGAFVPRLTIVSGTRSARIVEEPHYGNGFRVVLEFEHEGLGPGVWYEVLLEALGGGGGDIERYCPSTTNSSGSAAWIGWAGSLSLGTNDGRFLQAGACPPGHAALFMYGATPAALPLGHGTLCISPYAPGINRLGPAAFVQIDGTVTRPLDMSGLPFTAGSVWYFQLLFRDHYAGGAVVNLSDAIAVTFVP
jgi:hypothetical protein